MDHPAEEARSPHQQARKGAPEDGGVDDILPQGLGLLAAGEQGLVEGEDEECLAQVQNGEPGRGRLGEQQGKEGVAQHTGLKARGQIGRHPARQPQQSGQQPAQHQTQAAQQEHQHRNGNGLEGVFRRGKGREDHRREGEVDHDFFQRVHPVPGEEIQLPAENAQGQGRQHRQRRLENPEQIFHYLITPFWRITLA